LLGVLRDVRRGWDELSQSVQDLPQFFGQFRRSENANRDQLASTTVPAKAGDSFSLELEDRSGLGTLRNRDPLLAIDGGYLDLRPERGLRKRDGNLAVDVVIATPEERVLLDFQENIEISGRAPTHAGLALSREPQARAGIDAGRYLDGELPISLYLSDA
jgi:hypothetical protein